MSRSHTDAQDEGRFAGTVPTASEAPVPFLDIEDSGVGQRSVPLDREIIRLGRRRDNDIQILETHVSKHHADIVRRGSRFVIVDAGSKAGVFVNGAPVNERALADGDVITLGNTPIPRLVFRSSGSAAAPLPSRDLLSTLAMYPAEQSLENLAKFLEFSRALGGRLPLDEILENVVDLAVELTAAERGFLIQKGPDGSLDFRVARSRDRRPIPRAEILVSETIVREVLEEGRTRIVSDVQSDADFASLKSVVALGLGSAVALPLWRFAVHETDTSRSATSGEVFGVLYLDSQEPQGAITRIDRGILETLARDASAVIENTRLFRETEEKRRIEKEMEMAREVQAVLLPQQFWDDAHFEVSGRCVPSLRLGGDYLDQFRIGKDRCGLVMADVAGKGLPAALLAAALQGAMAAESATDQPLGTMLEHVNRALCRLAPEGKFVTLFGCVLSPDGELAFVNAGHPPPIALAGGGEVRRLATGGMALGIRDSNRYRESRIRLQAGDVVVLYTDGVTEAADRNGEFFDESRLEEVLRASSRLPTREIMQAILRKVDAFSGGAPPRDDITILVLKYLGAR
jgi:serine phosphatase RsbU (regulator of sigma subunit)